MDVDEIRGPPPSNVPGARSPETDALDEGRNFRVRTKSGTSCVASSARNLGTCVVSCCPSAATARAKDQQARKREPRIDLTRRGF
jgi:hypothetical protein